MTIRFYTTAIRSCWVLFVATACLASGCAQWNLNESLPTSIFTGDDNKPQIPARVVAVWVDTIRYTQGQTPTRGFGGRLVFYKGEEEKPIKVDGDVVIYAFDEEGRKPTDSRPTRKYVFKADQLDIHHSKSKVGHSYNFFLPWDNVGGYKKEISLIARFQPKLGPAVVSEQTHHLLPGKPLPEEMQATRREIQPPNDVRPASFISSPTTDTQRARMQTATIPLNSQFGQQTPVAEVRSRINRWRSQATEQAFPENPESSPQPSTGFPPSKSHPQAWPVSQQARDRARSPRRPSAWPFPGRSTPAGASGSESN